MNYRIARMSSLVLAFGIFFSISCSNLQNTQTSDSSNSTEESLQEQIETVNRQIAENPDNSELKVEKANLLFRYSQTLDDPSNRNPAYVNMRDITDNLSTQSENSPQLDEIMQKAWRTEQSRGIELLQKEQSDQSENEVGDIIAHFQNAITIIPDSLKTYHVLATTHYQHGNLNQAIETLELADLQSNQTNPEIKEKLAYLYLESGDLAEAEQRYRELVEDYPEKLLYKHGLINVLMLSNKHDQTIELLEELSGEYPTRYAYQESLATELYYLFKNRTDQYVENGANIEISEDEREELTSMLNAIHSIFESIQETLPTTEENLFRIATFYKNTAIRLKKISENSENEVFSELQTEYMKFSLPLWERLAELKPENLGYISNLHQVYLELEMDEDAESLERSYNF